MRSVAFSLVAIGGLALSLSCGGDGDAGGPAGAGGSLSDAAGSAGTSAGKAAGGTAGGAQAGGGNHAAGAAEGGAAGDASTGEGGEAGTAEPAGICGNDVLEPGEECDDGNTADDDGCSANCRVQYLLDDGHIDLFDLTYDAETEALVLRAKDDTGLYHLGVRFRAPEVTVVDVDAELSALPIPEDLGAGFAFLGSPGDTIYLLDQTQQAGLPWPGWSTERLLDTLPAAIDVDFAPDVVKLTVETEGPGDVFTFMTDGVGEPINRYVSTDDEVADVIPIGPSNHVHTAWVFTAPGDYYLKVTPSLTTTNAGVLTGSPAIYRFHVGPKLAPAEPRPILTIAGGRPDTTYRLHDTIELTVSQDPPSALDVYDWYGWGAGGYYAIPDQHGPTLALHAATSGEQLVSAALLGRSRRIVSLATAFVWVE